MEDTIYDYAIIGGGIVGLSIAHNLSLKFPNAKIINLEKEDSICKHQSGRNSGVIHSGIYYKPGSLKAKNCIEGYKLLIQFCQDYNIEFKLCGKLIVATNKQEIEELNKLYQRGIDHGLEGIKKLSFEEARIIEPNIKCLEAIFIPQTGITDYTLVAKKIVELLSQKNVIFKTNFEVDGFESNIDYIIINSSNQSVKSKYVINAAGLFSDKIGIKAGDNINHKIVPFKGEFYKLNESKSNLINGLVYPVPNPKFPFLGVHLTKMLNGNIKAGPNAILAFKKEGYRKFEFSFTDIIQYIFYPGLIKLFFNHRKEGWAELKRSISKETFYNSICQIVQGIEIDDIEPFTSGIRAQALYPDGKLEEDFLISRQGHFIHIYNSPSPAATACFAISKHVVGELTNEFH